MKDRIDLGIRIAGQKAEMPDEFVTKSQLVTPDGEALETLANGDLVVPAATSDHLVLVDELDASPGTLLDKIYPADTNVTISVVEIEGERVMEIGVVDSGGGLPAGTIDGEVLMWNGTDWVGTKSSLIANGDAQRVSQLYNQVSASDNSYVEAFIQNQAQLGEYMGEASTGSAVVTINSTTSKNEGLYSSASISISSKDITGTGDERISLMAEKVEIVSDNLTITSLSGDGDKYIGADSDGNIKAMPTPESGGGLPNGTINGQIARWDGSNWVPTKGVLVTLPGNEPYISIIPTDSSSEIGISTQAISLRNGSIEQYREYEYGNPFLLFYGNNYVGMFAVQWDGSIFSKALAGTGNRPLYADSSGNIQAQTGATGTFTTVDGKTVTVTNGIITNIV